MRRSVSHIGRLKGFTLIELLVVVAIIALLISILLPSLSNARKQAAAAACMSNLQQVTSALAMYRQDERGYLPDGPVGSLWSEAAWGVPKRDLWYNRLVPRYVGDPKVYVCPGDPFAGRFDLEARLTPTSPPQTDTKKASCGYGMNYLFRHFALGYVCDTQEPRNLMQIDKYAPTRPANTIMLADVGPDDELTVQPLYGSVDADQVGVPWRDGGRMLWDDGNRGWYSGPTWLTARHVGKINIAAVDGSIRRVGTIRQLTQPIRTRTNTCWGPLFVPGQQRPRFICWLCRDTSNGNPTPHYMFDNVGLWWWTGDPRRYVCPGREWQ